MLVSTVPVVDDIGDPDTAECLINKRSDLVFAMSQDQNELRNATTKAIPDHPFEDGRAAYG